jgi:hypothetical protein
MRLLGAAPTAVAAYLVIACGPSDPCRGATLRLLESGSRPYVGHWVVAHGDTLTMPELGDRFKLKRFELDTSRMVVGRMCRYRGAIIFTVPRAETLAVTWVGDPRQALIYGWPADLGPFAGIGATLHGDSLYGAILFDQRLGIQVKPGQTAQFVAGRTR